MTPATWDTVLNIVRHAGKNGITNKQINELLGNVGSEGARHTRYQDITHLTRIMMRAGYLVVMKNNDEMSNRYRIAEHGA